MSPVNWWEDDWKDLGLDVSYKWGSCTHATDTYLFLKSTAKDFMLGGVSFCHECPGPTWELVSKDPLTVTPSIHDPETGWHGFITDEKWVPA